MTNYDRLPTKLVKRGSTTTRKQMNEYRLPTKPDERGSTTTRKQMNHYWWPTDDQLPAEADDGRPSTRQQSNKGTNNDRRPTTEDWRLMTNYQQKEMMADKHQAATTSARWLLRQSRWRVCAVHACVLCFCVIIIIIIVDKLLPLTLFALMILII